MVPLVPYSHVLLLAAVLFLLGAVCAVARRNLVMILIGVEIMLNAAGIALIGASLRWQQLDGQALVLFIMAVAASSCSYCCSSPWGAAFSTPSWGGFCPGGWWRPSPAPRSWEPWCWPRPP
jgi:NADH-quinone oxidoreductase subunit K